VPHVSRKEIGDAELLRHTAAGDRQAFGELVRRHEAAVFRYVQAISDDGDRAADAQQETFIAAWRRAATFRGSGSARPWLLRIARHQAFRQHRRRSGEPRRHVPLEVLARDAGWGAATAERVTGLLEARQRVHAGFAALSADDREILLLRDLEEFSGEEVAEMFGISIAAQKSRLHRARLRFMAALHEGDSDAT
jgi:RNA polymerase sigma-70 factor, ECF subfamily